MTVGSLATYPPRYEQAWHVIRSISDQLERLYVYINDQGVLPGWMGEEPSNVTTLTADEGRGDLADVGKFYWSEELQHGATHFLLDDDISYPEDYVALTVKRLAEYGGGAVVGYDGWRIADGGADAYDRDAIGEAHHYSQRLATDRAVDVLAVGCMAYDTSAIRFPLAAFPTTHMSNLWVALHCQRYELPLICLQHQRQWLRPRRTPAADIHERNLGLNDARTWIINEHTWPTRQPPSS